MLNLLLADFFKLRKSMGIKVLFLIMCCSSLAMIFMAYLIPQGKIDGSLTGLGFLFSDVNMISILGGVVAGIYICGDFENKNFQDAIATGYTRGGIIVGKAIVFSVIIAFILLPYAIVTGIAFGTDLEFGMGSVGVGFLNLLMVDGGNPLTGGEIIKVGMIMFTLILVYVSQLSLCIPIAVILKKPAFVIALYYGFNILTAQLVAGGNSNELLRNIFKLTPYGGNYMFLNLASETGDFLKAILVSSTFIVIVLLISFFIFRRSEIK